MFATVDSVRNACEMGLIGNSPRTSGYCDYARQPSDLRSFGESFRGFSEEARTRGFPSPSLGGFGIVVCCASFIRLAAGKNLIVNIIGLFQATGNVRFTP